MKLALGTVVAYPPHGVGRVAGREKRDVGGVQQEVVVVALGDGLTVSLPLERARELLRPPVDEAGLRRVRDTLRQDGELSDEIWSKRLRLGQEQLRRGDPQELAALVRDGAQRDRVLTARGTGSKLAVSERSLCKRARELLSSEIGLVRGLGQEEAEAWIDEQLLPQGG